MNSATQDDAAPSALVVFTPGPRPWWLAWLHPRYGHCFVMIDRGDHWILLDPLGHRTEITTLGFPPDVHPASFYRALGYEVVETTIGEPPMRLAPIMLFTCVEAVKRIIGLHSRRILTPFQLLRHLKKNLTKRNKTLE